jgi:hypothetical protein
VRRGRRGKRRHDENPLRFGTFLEDTLKAFSLNLRAKK